MGNRRAAGQIGRNRKEQVLLCQAHALDHYDNLGAVDVLGLPRAAVCDGGFPNPPTRTKLRCPLCRREFEFAEMTEEHVPPRGGQSALSDGPKIVLLTCKTCNGDAGHGFEGDASNALGFNEVDVPEFACGVHGKRRVEQLPSGLFVVAKDLAFAMTDYKAGYLVAFATLGHRWGFDGALEPVREAISQYHAPDRKYGYLVSLRNATAEDFVYEVRSPEPCTIVHAATGVAVVMPLPGFSTIPQTLDGVHVTKATYRWPDMFGPYTRPWRPAAPPLTGHHHLVLDALSQGYLFHGDMCLDHVWADARR